MTLTKAMINELGECVHVPMTPEEQSEIQAQWSSVSPDDIRREGERRLSAGFDYDFGDERGTHRIGTTPDDMRGWREVSIAVTAFIDTGEPHAVVDIVTDTGKCRVTAMEWREVEKKAARVRQPIWTALFQMTNSPPANYTEDKYWQ